MTKDDRSAAMLVDRYESDHERLANTIMNLFPDYPGNDGETEGTIDCAIRIITAYKEKLRKTDISRCVADFYQTRKKPSLGEKQRQLIDAMAKLLGSFQANGEELTNKKRLQASLMGAIIMDVATMAAILDVDLSKAWEEVQKAMKEDDSQKNG
jgi:hypothetical protein